jgi:hypothetical protein
MNVESLLVPLSILNGVVFFTGMLIAGQLRRIAEAMEDRNALDHPEADKSLP